MTSRSIKLSENKSSGKSILYVMSRDQRVQANHALIDSQKQAITLGLPFAVLFVLRTTPGRRAREHFEFMLEGLKRVEADLKDLSIPFILLIGDPAVVLPNAFKAFEPESVYFDFSPFRGSRKLQKDLASSANFNSFVVDTHNVVPVWVASDKQEFSARTIRPKIHKKLADFLIEPAKVVEHPYVWPKTYMDLAFLGDKIGDVLATLSSNGQNLRYESGESAAAKVLDEFIKKRLKTYEADRNNPTLDGLSGLSPYLHFGQLSSLQVVLAVKQAVAKDPSLQAGVDTLIEEMIVRKELSDNFCLYNEKYNKLAGAPAWAIATLTKHEKDPREFLYSKEQFERAETHDEAWNAAQRQLVKTGKIHGYMRMYWAKKVLEWSSSPQEAVETLIYLNDFYSIDGADPNGYVGILWSVAGLHDRPWGERPVYGTIRCMVYAGLRRKFDVEDYIRNYAV